MKRIIVSVLIGSSLLLAGLDAAQAWSPNPFGHYCTIHGAP